MNITLLVNDEVFTYNLKESKNVDWEPTYLCLKFDNYPSKLEIEAEFLKLFKFSGTFYDFYIGIDANTLLEEENDLLYFYMLQLSVDPKKSLSPVLVNKSKIFRGMKKTDELQAFGSFPKEKPNKDAKLFISACGDPFKTVYDARFDINPKDGEVLRYLPIYTRIPNPHNLTKINDTFRGYLKLLTSRAVMPEFIGGTASNAKNFVSFLRQASHNCWEDEKVSQIKDFSIESPNIDNNAHRQILENLNSKSIVFKRGESFQSLKTFFAKKFNCNFEQIVAFPSVNDFIKIYLNEYLAFSAHNTLVPYWESDEGQAKLLSAAF